ncbi:tyrosine-type recombinase/integrase [Corynebacterium hesseae]|uniref:tyrosine-type recombinase/integrase n=1 Tax=Corynebacterium hesseae TaxID=2913502 RepID=UPI0022B9E4DE|nr:tyrosine-type recombinase/integrase [Corynebacterium hesseae]MCZ9299292.1 tyrosine-type recombinase/integrase [Corynebacterium hesseae]
MAYIVDLWTKKNPDKSPGAPKKVPSARWGVGKRWQVRWQEAGEWTSESFVTQDAAELHRSRVEVGQDEGTWITKEKKAITFEDLWEPWYASKAGISEKTRRDYLSVWQTHVRPTWGGEACASVQRSTVTAWIATLVNTKTVKDGQEPRLLGDAQKYKVGVVMRGLMDLAKERGAVASNPLEKAVAKKPGPSERRYLKVHEVDALMDAAPTDAARLLLRVLVMTGLRPGEAKALKVKDLDYDRARLMIRRDVDDLGRPDQTKTRKHRDVPIGGSLLRELMAAAEGKDPEAWLVPDERGHVWTTSRWRTVWFNMLQYTGIEGLDTYELRHTAASLAIAAGADVKTVQLMLGHASAAMPLDTYAHLWEEGLDAIPDAIESKMAAERESRAISERMKDASEAERRRSMFRVV